MPQLESGRPCFFVQDSLWQTVRRDLDDLRHDSRVASNSLTEAEKQLEGTDRRFKDCHTTCQGRNYPPKYREQMCRECKKRDGLAPETILILRLKDCLDGGMPIGRDELPCAVWQVLGKLRQRDAAEIGAMRIFG
jgi:hypothetical protein